MRRAYVVALDRITSGIKSTWNSFKVYLFLLRDDYVE